MLAARCLVLNSYLIDRFHDQIGDVKLSTNVVYGRNGLCTVGNVMNGKNNIMSPFLKPVVTVQYKVKIKVYRNDFSLVFPCSPKG